jgi:8-oxo-dGTP pyrophosphatase MutT (NUDIX family)
VARPASTVVLLRDSPAGSDQPFEVYFTRRPDHFTFVGGFHVFPGGAMDTADARPSMLARVRGLAAEQALAELTGASDGPTALAHWVTAVREVFEEAGVLLAVGADGANVDARALDEALASVPRTHEHHTAERFLDHLEGHDLAIDARHIRYFSHWTTPPGPPRRFDTRFFVARLPAGQTPVPHPTEVDGDTWLGPAAAIARWEAGEFSLMPPSVFTLQQLATFPTIDAVFARSDLAAEAELRGNARLAEAW